jgi:hypothetical protein
VQPGDDAGLRRPLDLEAPDLGKRLLDVSRGLVLLEGELGVGVQMAPPRDRLLLELRTDQHGRILGTDPVSGVCPCVDP